MNTQRIAAAVREIDRLTLALNWLREYGAAFLPEERQAFRWHFDPINASACTGAREAREQVEVIARLHIQTIIQHAIDDAANTIEIHTAAIREEAGAK